jgi:chromosome partitioning protein
VRIAEAPSHGLPVLIYDNACAGSQAYILLASEFIRRRRTAAEAALSAAETSAVTS